MLGVLSTQKTAVSCWLWTHRLRRTIRAWRYFSRLSDVAAADAWKVHWRRVSSTRETRLFFSIDARFFIIRISLMTATSRELSESITHFFRVFFLHSRCSRELYWFLEYENVHFLARQMYTWLWLVNRNININGQIKMAIKNNRIKYILRHRIITI